MALPSQEELCLIGLCAADGVGTATVRRLRRFCAERALSLPDALAMPAAELQQEAGLSRRAAAALRDMADPLEAGLSALEAVRRVGGGVVTDEAAEYPDRLLKLLGERAPAVLFLSGDISLLGGPLLAIVGSREPSPAAAEAARELARRQADAGIAVVSGGARGIDTVAHSAAVRSGGTVAVPACGIERFRAGWLRRADRAELPWCLVGQFPPGAPWRTAQALVRNHTIVALSDAVVAFEPRDNGGTWRSSIAALRMGRPLFIVCAAAGRAKRRGLERLVRLGAEALEPGAMPDGAALGRMIADYRPPPSTDQLPLFDLPPC